LFTLRKSSKTMYNISAIVGRVQKMSIQVSSMLCYEHSFYLFDQIYLEKSIVLINNTDETSLYFNSIQFLLSFSIFSRLVHNEANN
jgi:hypothetical protein